MKLLISAYACIPNRGSEPGNGWNYALRNMEAGNQVWCLTTPEGKEAIEAFFTQQPAETFHVRYIDVPHWLQYLYRYQPFVYLHYLYWQYKAVKVAKALDKAIDFDLVHHVTLASLQLGSGLWKLKKPFIFGPVGGGNFAPKAFKQYFSGQWSSELIRKFTSQLLVAFNPYFRKTMHKADLILVANHDTYAIAQKAHARHIQLFLDTSLPADFSTGDNATEPKKPTDVLQILWVGRIFARKGLPLVLEALSKVSIPFHLTIIGDGKQGYLLPQWLAQYALQDKVSWKGQVPWNEVRQAYQEHDVFMFCTLRDSFGSQFLEAMAFGLPIITLNHHGAKDHIPENAGIKVSVASPEQTLQELVAAVEYLGTNPKERLKLGENGKQFAQKHQWKNKIEALNALYRQVLETNNTTTPVAHDNSAITPSNPLQKEKA